MNIKKKRIFDNAECRNCSLKGSHIIGDNVHTMLGEGNKLNSILKYSNKRNYG
jgi:hypothetical protein